MVCPADEIHGVQNNLFTKLSLASRERAVMPASRFDCTAIDEAQATPRNNCCISTFQANTCHPRKA